MTQCFHITQIQFTYIEKAILDIFQTQIHILVILVHLLEGKYK